MNATRVSLRPPLRCWRSAAQGGVAILRDQVLVRGLESPFSDGGDSGALVYEERRRRPLGLLCAGSPKFSVVNKIERVLDGLGVS
jgi:hypothetical protein